MLDLDSVRWSELHHAYGPATDVPAKLRALEGEKYQRVISDLWGSIHHQGSVYSASFAAVPHLVRIAQSHPGSRGQESLIFVGSIAAVATKEDLAALPADIREDYLASVEIASKMVIGLLEKPDYDFAVFIGLLAGLAGLKRCRVLGQVLPWFVDHEFAIECPNCETQLYIEVDGSVLKVTAMDPVGHPNTPLHPITPATMDPGEWDGTYTRSDALRWLVHYAAIYQAYHEAHGKAPSKLRSILSKVVKFSHGPGEYLDLVHLLPYLFGKAECPACRHTFPVLETIGSMMCIED